MGAGAACSIAAALIFFNVFGLTAAVALVSVFAWLAALALQITALTFLTSWFLSWLAIAPAAAGEALKWTGVAGAAACAGVLVGLPTQLRSYEACLASSAPAAQGEESPIN